jgi:SAM-dependent methyltransferase
MINEELRDPDQRKFFSPATYVHHQATVPALVKYVHGKCIDIGCGDMPYKTVIAERVTEYHSLDRERRAPDVTFVGDVQNMSMLIDNTYDSAVCFDVLEHVPNPMQAISEIGRILKPQGILILSVPHLSRLHEEPHDFFRYTKYGLHTLLENTGFDVLEMQTQGSLFSFLGHQFSTIFVCLFWHVPILKHVIFFMNKWLCVLPCSALDDVLDKKRLFALGYTCIARKA